MGNEVCCFFFLFGRQERRGWTATKRVKSPRRLGKSKVKGQRKTKTGGQAVNISGFLGAVPADCSWHGASEPLMLQRRLLSHSSWEVMASALG